VAAVLTLLEARRIVLVAQCFGAARTGPPSQRRADRVTRRLAQYQLDSVNVFTRAHAMPLFSRLGEYDQGCLEGGPLFEYWGHAASLIDLDLYPCFEFRRQEARRWAWGRMRQLADHQPQLIEAVLAEVAERGPLTAREIGLGRPKAAGGWWEWSEAKTALEWLFRCGEVAVTRRNRQFERLYDLPGRAIPLPHLAEAPLDRESAHRVLIGRAAAALGVASARHLADYFRTELAETRIAIQALAVAGQLEEVAVPGWKEPAWLWAPAAQPRQVQANCLISPFDNLVFERRRLYQLFGVDYRISIYTPAERRTHGYYVYLFLRGTRFAARVDLKADRQRSRLLVQSAWLEDAGAPRAQAEADGLALAAELRRAAAWQGLTSIEVADRGTLAARLRAALARPATAD
jgi:uncharacterized protein YcaQ